MSSRHYYLLGSSTWFLSYGMQGVMFAWLITMVLKESPTLIGIAQMALLLPGTLLMLIGGSLADRYGSRRMLIISQSLSALAPLFLLIALTTNSLSYLTMIIYALMMGCAQAFVTPARDGLLNQVAGARVQRMVMLSMLMQFGGQILGFSLAGLANSIGATWVIGMQLIFLLAGVAAIRKVETTPTPKAIRQKSLLGDIARSIVEGGRSVFQSPSMRMVMFQNFAMGAFFMGSYIVTLPILIREIYAGDSSDLALINIINSIGLVSTIFLLLRFGDIHRQGRALLIAQAIGCFMLAGPGFLFGFPWLLVFMFGWGTCGGIAMSMSRTIMQEQAPPDQRGRIMAFYSFSFMGSGPLGALLSGYLVSRYGPQNALTISSAAMLTTIIIVTLVSKLWHLDSKPQVSQVSDTQ